MAALTACSAVARSLRHHHALAGGQAVGLDDQRVAEFSRANRSQRVGSGRADAVARGRHRVALHEILRERLAGFELRRRLRRTEDAAALGFETVGKARGQRRFGADDGQIDAFVIDEPNHGSGVQ